MTWNLHTLLSENFIYGDGSLVFSGSVDVYCPLFNKLTVLAVRYFFSVLTSFGCKREPSLFCFSITP